MSSELKRTRNNPNPVEFKKEPNDQHSEDEIQNFHLWKIQLMDILYKVDVINILNVWNININIYNN